MAEPQKTQQNFPDKNPQTVPEEETLGIRNPLVTPTPLAQNFLAPKLISPLGSHSINIINWGLISGNNTLLQEFSNQEDWQPFSENEFPLTSQNPLNQNSLTSEASTPQDPPTLTNIRPSSEKAIFSQPTTVQPQIDSLSFPVEGEVEIQKETVSSPTEVATQAQQENPIPDRLENQTINHPVSPKSKNSNSHFFLQKSPFPLEKRQKKVAETSENPVENTQLTQQGDNLPEHSLADDRIRQSTDNQINLQEEGTFLNLGKLSDNNPKISAKNEAEITTDLTNKVPEITQSKPQNLLNNSASIENKTGAINRETALPRKEDNLAQFISRVRLKPDTEPENSSIFHSKLESEKPENIELPLQKKQIANIEQLPLKKVTVDKEFSAIDRTEIYPNDSVTISEKNLSAKKQNSLSENVENIQRLQTFSSNITPEKEAVRQTAQSSSSTESKNSEKQPSVKSQVNKTVSNELTNQKEVISLQKNAEHSDSTTTPLIAEREKTVDVVESQPTTNKFPLSLEAKNQATLESKAFEIPAIQRQQKSNQPLSNQETSTLNTVAQKSQTQTSDTTVEQSHTEANTSLSTDNFNIDQSLIFLAEETGFSSVHRMATELESEEIDTTESFPEKPTFPQQQSSNIQRELNSPEIPQPLVSSTTESLTEEATFSQQQSSNIQRDLESPEVPQPSVSSTAESLTEEPTFSQQQSSNIQRDLESPKVPQPLVSSTAEFFPEKPTFSQQHSQQQSSNIQRDLESPEVPQPSVSSTAESFPEKPIFSQQQSSSIQRNLESPEVPQPLISSTADSLTEKPTLTQQQSSSIQRDLNSPEIPQPSVNFTAESFPEKPTFPQQQNSSIQRDLKSPEVPQPLISSTSESFPEEPTFFQQQSSSIQRDLESPEVPQPLISSTADSLTEKPTLTQQQSSSIQRDLNSPEIPQPSVNFTAESFPEKPTFSQQQSSSIQRDLESPEVPQPLISSTSESFPKEPTFSQQESSNIQRNLESPEVPQPLISSTADFLTEKPTLTQQQSSSIQRDLESPEVPQPSVSSTAESFPKKPIFSQQQSSSIQRDLESPEVPQPLISSTSESFPKEPTFSQQESSNIQRNLELPEVPQPLISSTADSLTEKPTLTQQQSSSIQRDLNSPEIPQPSVNFTAESFPEKPTFPQQQNSSIQRDLESPEVPQPLISSTSESFPEKPTFPQQQNSSIQRDLESPEVPQPSVSSTAESLTENPTFSQQQSQTIAQLLSESEVVPQLPKVLENITVNQPLTFSHPLVQRLEVLSETFLHENDRTPTKNQPQNYLTDSNISDFSSTNYISQKSQPFSSSEQPKKGIMIQQQKSDFSATDIPNSWSNIEELLGESNTPLTEPKVIQASRIETQPATPKQQKKQSSDIRTSMILPPGVFSGVAEIHSLDLQQQPTAVKALMEKTIQSRTQLEEKTATRKAEPVPVLTMSNLGLPSVENVTEQQEEEKKTEEPKTDQVEALAREIYGLVRQRFEVERERHGFYYERRLL